jgi:hypothetical protein
LTLVRKLDIARTFYRGVVGAVLASGATPTPHTTGRSLITTDLRIYTQPSHLSPCVHLEVWDRICTPQTQPPLILPLRLSNLCFYLGSTPPTRPHPLSFSDSAPSASSPPPLHSPPPTPPPRETMHAFYDLKARKSSKRNGLRKCCSETKFCQKYSASE